MTEFALAASVIFMVVTALALVTIARALTKGFSQIIVALEAIHQELRSLKK